MGQGTSYEGASSCIGSPYNICVTANIVRDCEEDIVVDSNCICAFYEFDESADTDAEDASVSEFDLTKKGAPGPGTGAGKIGTARTFNGTDQYFSRLVSYDESDCFSIQQGHTIWGWFRTEVQDGLTRIIANKSIFTPPDLKVEWRLFKSFDGSPSANHSVTFQIGTTGPAAAPFVEIDNADLTTKLDTTSFHFVAAYVDTANKQLFFRVNDFSKTVSFTGDPISPDSSIDFAMGASSDGDSNTFFEGELDAWGVAPRILTDAELDCLYNETSGVSYGVNFESAAACLSCICCDCIAMCDCACDLCAYYKLDETTAADDATDATPNMLDLTANSSPGTEATDTVINNARTFDGSTQSFSRLVAYDGNDCFSIQRGHTIWGWFRIDGNASASSGYHVLAAKSDGSTTVAGVDEWVIRANAQTGKIELNIGFASAPPDFAIEISTPIRTGVWYFVAAWANPATKQAFLRFNGDVTVDACMGNTEVASRIASEPTFPDFADDDPTIDFALGAWSDGTSTTLASHLNGALDEWGLASTVLSKSQLDAIYNQGAGMSHKDIIEKVLCCDEEGNESPNSIGQLIFGQECFNQFLQDCCNIDCCEEDCLGAYYALDESSGSAIDAGPNGFDLSEVFPPNGSVPGKIGTARLSGSGSHFSRSHESCFSIQQGGTIAGWFKNGTAGPIAAKSNTRTIAVGDEWTLYLEVTGKLAFRIGDGVGGAHLIETDAATFLDASSFHFVAGIVDSSSSTISIYADGVLKSAGFSGAASENVSLDFRLMALSDASDIFSGGAVDEIGIYTKALIQTELDCIYNVAAGVNFTTAAACAGCSTT